MTFIYSKIIIDFRIFYIINSILIYEIKHERIELTLSKNHFFIPKAFNTFLFY